MRIRFYILLLLALVPAGRPLEAVQELADRGSLVVAGEAWSWNMAPWDSEKVISWNDYQYTMYWDKEGYLTLARRNLMDDSVQNVRFTDARISVDNPHNSTTIGISPEDGRLHISYHQWTTRLRYRRSAAGFISSPPSVIAATQFGAEEAMIGQNENQVTYPRFFNLNDGTLFVLYRGDGGSSNADSFLNRYNSGTGRWERLGMLFSRAGTYSGPGYATSTARNAYLNDVVVDRANRIHLTWTYREGSGHQTNHDLYYATSDDSGVTWQNNAGETIANLAAGTPIRIDSPGIRVVDIPYNSWLINQDTMVVDSQSQPHVVTQISSVVTATESQRNIHYIHYWRTSDGEWHNKWVDPIYIPRTGSRPRGTLAIDGDDTLHFLTAEAGIVKYWFSPATDNWSSWTARNLFSGYTGEGLRYDRRLWRNNGVLSVPLIASSNRSYQLRTLVPDPPKADASLGDFGQAGDLEGWNLAKHLEGEVSDGKLHLRFQGNDPYLRKTGIHHDAAAYRYVKIRLRNESAATNAAVFFIMKNDRTWNYQKAKVFSIEADSPDYRSYVLDMSTKPAWQGTVVGIRFDVAEDATAGGEAAVDWIELSNSPDVPSPIEEWRRSHFSDEDLVDPAINGDLADPVGDGVPNLLNYALGNNPRQPQRAESTPGFTVAENEWIFSFDRARPAEDIIWVVEMSQDLTNWEPVGEEAEILLRDDGRQRVLSRGPLDADDRSRFFRLRVSRQ